MQLPAQQGCRIWDAGWGLWDGGFRPWSVKGHPTGRGCDAQQWGWAVPSHSSTLPHWLQVPKLLT